jgi:nucleoside-diphosphate-sugar epimerase
VGTNINELFAELAACTGYEREAMHGPAKVGETRQIYLTAAKAQRKLGWEARVTLREGLEATVAYFRGHETG